MKDNFPGEYSYTVTDLKFRPHDEQSKYDPKGIYKMYRTFQVDGRVKYAGTAEFRGEEISKLIELRKRFEVNPFSRIFRSLLELKR